MSLVLSASNRPDKKAVAILKEGSVPVIVYGKGKENISAIVEYEPLRKMILKCQKHLPFTLDVEGKKILVVAKEYQFDLIHDTFTHVDFYMVDEKAALEVPVPVEFIGNSDVLRTSILTVVSRTILVSALSKDIPVKFEIDLALLTATNDKIRVSDVEFPKGVTSIFEPKRMIAKAAVSRAMKSAENESETAENAGGSDTTPAA
ncbi:50S ribosomal protein L25 [Candidatus Peregrinibacteria bacterium]|nr:MAG: 50S ribosomal protein L25 [Candidatus Peregrinibacteria bacterium]